MIDKNGRYTKGIIDIGTNSCRLFIAEIMETEERINILNELVKEVEIVKLGEEVNENHFLKEEAMERTIECLRKYKETADKYGVKELKAFATSATRDAKNREEFLKKVRDLGIEIKCISGEEEAKLNFLGNSLVFDERILVIDIGGGSTEFTLGKNNKIDFIKSIDIGAVRATEKFFSQENYSKENIEKCKKWVKENIREIIKIKNEEFKTVGVAGTATTQISVKKEMKIYDSQQVHMSEITVEELERNLKLFISKNIEERKEIIGLEPKRADVIIAGTIILITILKELNKGKIVVSESDNLTGAMIKEEKMSERLEWILEAYESFRRSSERRLVAGNIFDYFMQDFRGEISDAYDPATKEEIKEDIKEMAEIIYNEEDKHKREFLVKILVNIVKML